MVGVKFNLLYLHRLSQKASKKRQSHGVDNSLIFCCEMLFSIAIAESFAACNASKEGAAVVIVNRLVEIIGCSDTFSVSGNGIKNRRMILY